MYQDAHYALLVGQAACELGPELGSLLVFDAWDPGDPWGSTMGAAFTLNDALGVIGGQTNDTYIPGADPRGALEGAHGGPELLKALETGALSVEAAERAEQALDHLLDVLRAAGRDY